MGVTRQPPDQREASAAVDQALADLLADLTYPMVVVTATDGSATAGCLVGLHTQVSIDPMRVGVFLEHANYTYEVAQDADALAVHYLRSGDHDIAERFGSRTGPEADKFAGVDLLRTGEPEAVEIAHIEQRFVGTIEESVDCGDHTMFVLSPVRARRAESFEQLSNHDVADIEPGHPRTP